jgi:hypothetical protein
MHWRDTLFAAGKEVGNQRRGTLDGLSAMMWGVFGLLHFARARKVSRYFAMNSRPNFNCFSTSFAPST